MNQIGVKVKQMTALSVISLLGGTLPGFLHNLLCLVITVVVVTGYLFYFQEKKT